MGSETDSYKSFTVPNKRLKTLSPDFASNSESKKSFEDQLQKSQEIQPSPVDKSSQTCLICLSEDGQADRGKLDCCDHYLCFVCIVEWAKIESRCPACKRRFFTIRRTPTDGFSRPQQVLRIPVRDQVSCTDDENTESGRYDPYAHVRCSVCNGNEEESLLLLCDLCDSAAHTYCVGLGNSVPEGDWFCPNCNDTTAAQPNSDLAIEDENHNLTSTSETHVSISDIVRESSIAVGNGIPLRRVTLRQNIVATESTGARTLRRCRNIHSHIRTLRENWHALQRGSLTFPSSSSTSCGNSQNQEVLAGQNDRAGARDSTSIEQPGKPEHDKTLHDVDKAWKMMEIAKAQFKNAGSLNLSSRDLSGKGIKAKDSNKSSSSHKVKSQQFKINGLGRTHVEKYKSCSSKTNEGLQTNSWGYGEASSSRNAWAYQSDIDRCENGIGKSKDVVDGAQTSSGNLSAPDEKFRPKKGFAEGKAGKDHGAKSEIQSLVKINLKLLSRDQKLGIDEFKEVARLATHTILAACGLEPQKYRMRVLQKPACSHTEHNEKLHKSSLMPNCCRECFIVYVKDVVNVSMVEKLGFAKSC